MFFNKKTNADRNSTPVTVARDFGTSGLRKRLARIFGRPVVDAAFWSELEEALIEADIAVGLVMKLMSEVESESDAKKIRGRMAAKMVEMLSLPGPSVREDASPHVILVLGVNGVGKTTTIAKLAHRFMSGGKKVILVAADTYRAAAIEQLSEWGRRLGCDVISRAHGADSAAVAFDGVNAARARGGDVVIIDTAGRLHTRLDLMEELKKVCRVIGKAMDGAPHEKLLVIDSTFGSNGFVQAKKFHESLGLTGVVAAKLDGTAKGGVLLSIAHDLMIPIEFVGTGEKVEDLAEFNSIDFINSIISAG